MRGESEVTVGALDGGDGAGLAIGQAVGEVAAAVPPGHGIGEDAQHLAEQLALEREGKAQREGHGEHELPDGDVGQDVVDKVRGARAHASAQAARADGSGFTAEGDRVVLAAGLAVKVCEASPQDATRHEAVQLVGHELGQRATRGLVVDTCSKVSRCACITR